MDRYDPIELDRLNQATVPMYANDVIQLAAAIAMCTDHLEDLRRLRAGERVSLKARSELAAAVVLGELYFARAARLIPNDVLALARKSAMSRARDEAYKAVRFGRATPGRVVLNA